MENKYLDDLKEIREIMSRSSRFLSLSGWSGIAVGITALIGAYLTNAFVLAGHNYLDFGSVTLLSSELNILLLFGCSTLIISVGLVIFLTTYEAKKQQQVIWDQQTKRIVVNLAIPLVTGGIISILVLLKGYLGLVFPFTLVFYGLALVNVSKFTISEIRSLGLLEIALGLVALLLINYALICWIIGFGLLHIIYGFIVKARYRS